MAKKNKQDLSTSVNCIYPDDTIELFETIEDASKKCNLTTRSISMLCNRKGSKSKSNLQFTWADDRTKKSKQAKRNKSKGNNFELEIIKKLKEIGFENCVSSRSQSKLIDNDKIDIIDLDNKLPINIQTKYTTNTPNYFTISESCSDKSKPFTIVWKKTADSGSISKGTVAIIPIDLLYEFLKKW